MQLNRKPISPDRAVAPSALMAVLITLFLLPLCRSESVYGGWAQDRPLVELEVGKSAEREMAGGQVHRYQLSLSGGEYLHLVVEQRGIDVVVAVFDPEGKEICRIDSPYGAQGPETVYLIAKSSGSYRLELSASERDSAPGRYQARIEALRIPTPQDNTLAAWHKSFAEGMKLQSQVTAESLRGAIGKYKEALGYLRDAIEPGAKAQTLHGLGQVYYQLGERKSALDAFLQELPVRRAAGDRGGEAFAFNSIGQAYHSLGQGQEALDYHKQSLHIFRLIENPSGEALALNSIGSIYDSIGEKQNALDHYNQSLAITRVAGNRNEEPSLLNNIGAVYDSLGEKQKALDHYNQSLLMLRAAGNRNGEAVLLNNIGMVYYSLGENQKALDHYNQALPLRRATGDRSGEAATLNNIGGVYLITGEMRKALDYYSQALSLVQAIGNRRGEAATLNNFGRVYDSLGEKQRALDYYDQALSLRRATGDRSGESATLTNIGRVYNSLGERQKALDYYNQALPLKRAVGDRGGEATTLNNIAVVYASLGEKQRALDYYNQTLPLARATGDRNGEAGVLNNIAVVYNSLGEKQRALDYYNQALPLRRAVGDRGGEAITLNNIGATYYSLGEKEPGYYSQALEYYKQALPLEQAVGDRRGEAATLNNIGRVYDSLGEKRKALEYINLSLQLCRSVSDRVNEAPALYQIARIERQSGDLIESRAHIERALAIIESLRAKVDIHELRASFFATVQNYYELYVDLLMRLHKQSPSAGFDAAALNACERARARSLLELLIEARADIRRGVDKSLLERERSLQQQLNAKSEDRIRLLSGKYPSEQADAAAKEIDALTTELQNAQAQIRATSPSYAALVQPSPLSLGEIQRQLDPDVLLLEYSLGSERSFLWAVTQTTLNSFELPKRIEIEPKARAVYNLLTARNRHEKGELPGAWQKRVAEAEARYAEDAAELSRMLLGPVARLIGGKRLLIVADGALLYLPFAALPLPKRGGKSAPLIVEHEVFNLPSASTIAVLRRELGGRKAAPLAAAVIGDPVFSIDDPRVSSAKERRESSPGDSSILTADVARALRDVDSSETAGALSPLPFTRQEATSIIELLPQRQGLLALDFKANKAAATSPDLSQYRIVHFATHGLIDSLRPELSGIVLSLVDEQGKPQDGFLRLHEIYNLNLPAEMVVLSSCRTGLGVEIKGEGLVGLTRGFMYAGAARLVASQWKVDDEATAELMKRFYAKIFKKGERPVAALRAAQIEMWRQKDWKSPFYWAAFVFQGEWR
jgi:CHAT domain-containing protein/Tfp pilus assembly protein PilF